MKKNYLSAKSQSLKSSKALLILFLLYAGSSFAQSPGGVNASLTSWFKSTSATGTTAATPIVVNGINGVSSWSSVGGTTANTYAVTQTTTGSMPIYTPGTTNNGNFNFNPFLQFNGSNSVTVNLSNTSTVDILGSQGSVFIVANTYNNLVNKNTAFTYNLSGFNNTTNRWQFKPGFRTQTGIPNSSSPTLGIGSTADYYEDPGSNDYPAGQGTRTYPETSGIILLSKGVNTSATSNEFSGKRNGDRANVTNNFDPTYYPSVSQGLYLGSNAFSEAFTGGIAEVITFNTNLSDADVNKVESYLAVKYGVTLTQGQSSTNRDYTAPDGSIFWAADADYKFNITGIARDDASGLYQKQSRSVHNNALISVYNKDASAAFPATNAGNTTIIDATNSYFMTADNGLGNTIVPGNCVNRIARTWKVQKTGSIADVTISAAKANLPSDVKYLVVSSDPSFPAASLTKYALNDDGTTLSVNVNIPTGSYFSYGLDQAISTTAAAIGCTTTTTTVTATGLGTWFADASNPAATTIADPILNTTAISGFTVPGVYKFNWGSPSCFITITITYSDAVPAPPTVAPSTISYCQNQTATALVATGATGNTITWVDASSVPLPGGAPTPDTSATGSFDFYVIQTTPGGCESLPTKVTVTVNPATTAVADFTLTDTSVCAGDANVTVVKGTGFTDGGIYTVAPATGLVIDAATGEINVAGSAPSTYTVTYTVADDATICLTGDTDSQTITINAAPVVATIAPLALCDTNGVTFNLTSQEAALVNGQTGVAVTYYTDAAATNAITTPSAFTNTTSPQTIYVVLSNGNCSVTGSFTIETLEVPALADDLSIEGCSPFNLTAVIAEIGTDFTLGYYASEADATADVNAITTPTIYPLAGNEGTVYIRAENASGCYDVAPLALVTGACQIQRGISPGDSDKNNTFDLSGYNVTKISIFNRYGKEVYSKNNYRNEWGGQGSNGDELPTGTYFYTFNSATTGNKTGWIYINRQN